MIRNYFQALENGKTVEQARPIAEKFIEKSDAEYLYMFMHNMMDFPKKDARDFEIGLKASEKCVTLVEKEYPKALPKTLDTHARMLYRNDRLDEAIATLKRALKLAPEGSRRRPEIEKRLKKYEGEKAEAGDTKE